MNTCATPPCQSTLALDTPQTTAGTCAEALFIWHGGQPPYSLDITQAAPGSLTSLHQTAVATLQSTYYAWTAAAVPGSSLIVVVQDALHQTANAQYLAIVGDNGCLALNAFASAPASQSGSGGGLSSTQSSFSSSSSLTPSPASTFHIPSASPIVSSVAAPSSSFLSSPGPTRTIITHPGFIAGIAVLCTVVPLLFAAFLYRMRTRTRHTKRQTILYQPAAFSEKDSPLPRTPQALDTPTGCVADTVSSVGSSKRVPPSYTDTKTSRPDVRLPAAAHIHLPAHTHAHGSLSQAGLSPAVLPLPSLYAYPAGPQMRAMDGGVRLSGGSSYPIWDVEAGVLPPAYDDL